MIIIEKHLKSKTFILSILFVLFSIGIFIPIHVKSNVKEIKTEKQFSQTICPSLLNAPTNNTNDESKAYDPQFEPNAKDYKSNLKGFYNGTRKANLIGESKTDTSNQKTSDAGLFQKPVVLSTSSKDGAAALGYAYQMNNDGDAKGIAMNECLAPKAKWTFVGLKTGTFNSKQYSARLTLVNPFQTSTSIIINAYTYTGKVDNSNIEDVVIPANSERSVLLEGIIKQSDSFSIDVISNGPAITAFVQETAFGNLKGYGVSYIPQSFSSEKSESIIPGVISTDNMSNAYLSIFVPKTDNNKVNFSLMFYNDKTSTDIPGLDEVTVTPGTTYSFSIDQLPKGIWGAVIKADRNVNFYTSVCSSSSNDFTYQSSSNELTEGQIETPSIFSYGIVVYCDERTTLNYKFVKNDGTINANNNSLELNRNSKTLLDFPSGINGIVFSSTKPVHTGIVTYTNDFLGSTIVSEVENGTVTERISKQYP